MVLTWFSDKSFKNVLKIKKKYFYKIRIFDFLWDDIFNLFLYNGKQINNKTILFCSELRKCYSTESE